MVGKCRGKCGGGECGENCGKVAGKWRENEGNGGKIKRK
jgi:hypothetical protein